MGDGLDITREEKGEILILRLRGKITEDSQFEELTRDPKTQMVFDLQGIERINSYGIREWINALKKVAETARTIVFVRCAPVMVEQFNMISNFGAGGVVYSVMLPYFCENCEKHELKLYELPEGQTPEAAPELTEVACPSCNAPLIFDDIEDEFFCFLGHQKGKNVDAALLGQIRETG